MSIKDRIARLFTVKSLVTIALTSVVSYLAIVGAITGQELLGIYTTVIAFYFGTQAKKEE